MNGVDDLGGLLDQLLTGHILHANLLNLCGRGLLGLAGCCAPVTMKHSAGLNAVQLKEQNDSE